MRMIIADEFYALSHGKQGHSMEVTDNSAPVPRIGEQVEWNYEPTPVVQTVLHDFKKGVTLIVVK
jgi:hypothetical protein